VHEDGSAWRLLTNQPWPRLAQQCPDLEPHNITNPQYRKRTHSPAALSVTMF